MHDIGKRYGCYGNTDIKTPSIDRLAEDAVRFNNHFCHFPLCGPSRANIFSGLRPLKTKRFTNDPFFPNFRKCVESERIVKNGKFYTLPEVFKQNGYYTFGAGLVFHDVDDAPSWSEPFWRPSFPQNVPADMRIYNEASPNPWVNPDSFALIRERIERLKNRGYTDEFIRTREGIRKVKGPAVEAGKVNDEVYFDGQTTERAIKFLKDFHNGKLSGSNIGDALNSGNVSHKSYGYGKTRPFFLAVGLTAGHLPWNSPEKYWELYNRRELTLPGNEEPPSGVEEWSIGDSEPAQYYTQHGYEKPWRASRDQSMELLHGYYAAISYVDAMVGRLIKTLRELNLYEDTVIVLTSDHGFHAGEHGYWGKHNLWDVSLRVPLLIKPPKDFVKVSGMMKDSSNGRISYGEREVTQLTEHVDIYPTLCSLAGIHLPAYLDGSSMIPLLSSGDSGWNKDAVFSHRRHQWHDRIKAYDIGHTIRTTRYRYTMYLDKTERVIAEELFDYDEDPGELVNRVTWEGYKKVRDELKARIGSFLRD